MATVPTPYDWTAGVAPTAAQLDAGVRDVTAFLLNPPRLRVSMSANLSLGNGVWTNIGWDTETWDTDSMHSASSSRLVAATAGQYLLTVNLVLVPNATGGRGLNVTKNGAGTRSTPGILGDALFPAWNQANQVLNMATEVSMAAADYVEVFAYQNSGGALNLLGGTSNTWATLRWIST